MEIDFDSMNVGDSIIMPGTIYDEEWFDQMQAYVTVHPEKQFEIAAGWRVVPDQYDENGNPRKVRQFSIIRTR